MEKTVKETILVNCERFLTRIVLLSGKKVEYFWAEKSEDASIVGNIYKGKITNVLKGLNAAFVNIGTGRNGFLPFEETDQLYAEEDLEEKDSRPRPDISQYRVGQEIIVQVTKPGSASKGVKLTTQVSLPGKRFVLIPFSSLKGVSRRIEDRSERKRLLDIFGGLVPPGMGFIVRTDCEGRPAEQMRPEVKFMAHLWAKVKRQSERVSAPALLWEELDLTRAVLRDHAGEHTGEILVDDERMYRKLRFYAHSAAPELLARLKLFREKIPLMSKFNLEQQLDEFLHSRVALPSGGYLLFEEGETLAGIDVNTGGSARRNAQETIFHTNLEAAREIPRQIRIRNLSGLLVIDFIDMRNPHKRKEVFKALTENLEPDKARTKILTISHLGLVEMSREKMGLSLRQILTEKCRCCAGTGRNKSLALRALELKNQLLLKMQKNPGRRFTVQLSGELHEFVRTNESLGLRFLERRRVRFQTSSGQEPAHFEILE